jgi:hypothetical protein
LQREDLERRVERAIQTFRKRDNFLMQHKTREESLSHRLATYLEPSFPRHQVDCEYDKRIEFDENAQMKLFMYRGRLVGFRPDIIVHRRGTMRFNLLAVQLKKKDNPTGRQKDDAILKCVTSLQGPYLYEYGLFLDIGGDSSIEKTWYRKGADVS